MQHEWSNQFKLIIRMYVGLLLAGSGHIDWQRPKCNILSRVYGYVIINNGSWIGWLDLLTVFFSISLNHNQLQELTINDCLRLAPFSFSLILLVSSLLLWLTWFWVTNDDWIDYRLQYEWIPLYEWTTYIFSRRIHRKHIRYCWEVFSARCVATSTARTTENTVPAL
jgi:hypothetical protein